MTQSASFTVRIAEIDEAAAVSALASRTFILACPPSITAESAAAFAAEQLSPEVFTAALSDPREVVLVAVDEDSQELSGYCYLAADYDVGASTRHETALPDLMRLSKLYVDEAHHHSGVAHQLVDAAEAWAVEHGVERLWLSVNQENARANRFYEKRQYHQVGTMQFLVDGVWYDDFVRLRTLER